MSTLHTYVRHWELEAGERQAYSDRVVARIATAHAEGQRKGQFFAVVESADNAVRGRAACALVAHTLSTVFYQDHSASITSALRRAFRSAHHELCAHNRQIPPGERTLIGVSCAVVHNESLYLAQVQPTQALFVHQKQVHAIPHLGNAGLLLSYQDALGSPLYRDPEPTRFDLKAGDTLVLCSSNVAPQIPAQQLEASSHNDARTIADGLHERSVAASLYEARALVVRWEEAAADDEAVIDASRAHARWRLQQQTRPSHHAPRVLAREQSLPPTTIAARTARNKPRKPQQPSSEPSRRSHASLDDGQPRQRRAVSREHDRASRSRHAPQSRSTAPRTLRQGANAQRSASQTPARRNSKQRRRPMRWIVALLTGAVLALVAIGAQQFQQREWRAAAAALSQVNQSLDAAEGASTPDQAQQELALAETALRTNIEPLVQNGVITDSHPAVWNQYQQVLGRYDHVMAAINRVAFVDQLQPVASLPDGQGLISRIVLGKTAQTGGVPSIFLLDRNTGRLFQSGQEAPLLQRGDLIGVAPISRLRDVLWRDNKLLVFERGDPAMPGYRMMYREGDQWTAVQLARFESMVPIDGDLPLAAFDDHVFVWDRDTKQVWRYIAGEPSTPPMPAIGDTGDVALDRVVDIAVEGRIYLLNSDGSILVVDDTGAIVQQLPVPELAMPITTMVRFVVTPDGIATDGSQHPGAIYLLDTQNERVVQIDKVTGTVIQQIQARQQGVLNQLTDLAVDEPNRMLYLANGAQVVQTLLPTPPQPGFNSSAEPPQ